MAAVAQPFAPVPNAAAPDRAAVLEAGKRTMTVLLGKGTLGVHVVHYLDILFVLAKATEETTKTLSTKGVVLTSGEKAQLACDLALTVLQMLLDAQLISQSLYDEAYPFMKDVEVLLPAIESLLRVTRVGDALHAVRDECCKSACCVVV